MPRRRDQPPPGWGALENEPVRVVPYDPVWSERFEAVRGLLDALPAPWLSGGIHHVGSTAVPGFPPSPPST